MAKKKNKPLGTIIIPKELIYQAKKERFNPFQTGTGAHRDKKKYTRKQKYKNKEF